jgi:hypothetical protein
MADSATANIVMVKSYKGWVKIGEVLYPITDMEIDGIAHVSLNWSDCINPLAQLDHTSSSEMSDDEAFELMDNIRREMK